MLNTKSAGERSRDFKDIPHRITLVLCPAIYDTPAESTWPPEMRFNPSSEYSYTP
jgi:hypothetical protein